MEVWKSGRPVVWKFGSTEVRKSGTLGVWGFVSLEVWKFGGCVTEMGVWLRG